MDGLDAAVGSDRNDGVGSLPVMWVELAVELDFLFEFWIQLLDPLFELRQSG